MAETSAVPVKSANGTAMRRTEPPGFFDDIWSEMERWWARPFSFFPRFRSFAAEPMVWAPRMDVFEKDNAIVVKTELPGLTKEDVKVEVEGDDLVVRGERKSESEVKEEDYYRSERTFGSFYRRMPLPAGVTPDQIEASLKDGVLEVRVPKPAAVKSQSKTVPIS